MKIIELSFRQVIQVLILSSILQDQEILLIYMDIYQYHNLIEIMLKYLKKSLHFFKSIDVILYILE